MKTIIALLCFVPALCPATAIAQEQDERFTSDRENPKQLPVPEEDESFTFAVFGDRTGGPVEGIEVLAQAVQDVNLVEPDLVMTVGDMVQGYNQSGLWQRQADEYSETMDGLISPWYPVAGNHDVYWRGEGRPEAENEANYERHFAPLWYAFRHKDCWFIVLYTDEGNPQTGERNFNKPECQRMSEEQFAFLDGTLELAKEARHVFIFLHHPRWQGGKYGDDWQRVHERLADAGNVSAVFGGHIHHMVYDGLRDGIEYFTLATTGGAQPGDAPRAGFLHHWNLVTVREDHIAVAALPVGAAIDPRLVTREVSYAARVLNDRFQPIFAVVPEVHAGQAIDGAISLELTNPLERGIEVQLALESADSRWAFTPDHRHTVLKPGEKQWIAFGASRAAGPLDASFRAPLLRLQLDYLAETHRVSLPQRSLDVPVQLGSLPEPSLAEGLRAFDFDGGRDALAIPHEKLALPDGPFTVECWFRADRFADRVGLLAKTEGSEFGIFVGGGVPRFVVHLDGRYIGAMPSDEFVMEVDRWQHIAGVFDGEEVRLYLDGQLIGSAVGQGRRTVRALPFLIGADVDGAGRGNSFFDGAIDEVRVSTTARYAGESFEPQRRHAADEETALLFHLDQVIGIWAYDDSPEHAHANIIGAPRIAAAE